MYRDLIFVSVAFGFIAYKGVRAVYASKTPVKPELTLDSLLVEWGFIKHEPTFDNPDGRRYWACELNGQKIEFREAFLFRSNDKHPNRYWLFKFKLDLPKDFALMIGIYLQNIPWLPPTAGLQPISAGKGDLRRFGDCYTNNLALGGEIINDLDCGQIIFELLHKRKQGPLLIKDGYLEFEVDWLLRLSGDGLFDRIMGRQSYNMIRAFVDLQRLAAAINNIGKKTKS